MNAYELADYVEAREQNNATLKEAAEMLRTQALEIKELKAILEWVSKNQIPRGDE